MPRTLKTPNIRVGDRVKIVKPEFFVRCGYPLHFQGEVDRVMKEQGETIRAFLESQGVKPPRIMGDVSHPTMKVAKAIAYCLLRQASFGGNARTIHTERIAAHKGEVVDVVGVSFVKTGVYERGFVDYDGEHTPAYLGDEKTHRILALGIYGQLHTETYSECLRIEAENVKLITKGAQ